MAGLNNPVGSQVRDLCSLNEDNTEWRTSWLSPSCSIWKCNRSWGCRCLYTGLPAILGRLWYAVYTHHQVLMKSLDSHACSSLLFMMEVMVLTLGDTSYNLTHCHVVYEVFLLSFLCSLADIGKMCYLKIWEVQSTKWFLDNHMWQTFPSHHLLSLHSIRSRNIFTNLLLNVLLVVSMYQMFCDQKCFMDLLTFKFKDLLRVIAMCHMHLYIPCRFHICTHNYKHSCIN